jgi:cell division protein FtsI (penicillin-binding protein 3)
MGYQVAVTPIQMAAAVSAVANGGQLFEPRVVRAFIQGSRRTEVPQKLLRRAISAETASELTAMMEGVVERGTAKAARIEGFTIAGKTGTAAKLVNGRYSKSDYNASFVGFAPSRKPELAIVVVMDMARVNCGSCYYGGVVAAPIFQRIAEAALRHRGIGPTVNPPPPVLLARADPAAELQPTPVRALPAGRASIEPAAAGFMPDLRGLSAREALRALAQSGVQPRLDGSGFVVEQSIEPGLPLVPGETCVLTLGRRPAAPAGGAPQ